MVAIRSAASSHVIDNKTGSATTRPAEGEAVNLLDFDKQTRAFELLARGVSLRHVAILVGIDKKTAGRFRKALDRIMPCDCGLMAGHKGWCAPRVSRSPKRQQFLARWMTDEAARGAAEENG